MGRESNSNSQAVRDSHNSSGDSAQPNAAQHVPHQPAGQIQQSAVNMAAGLPSLSYVQNLNCDVQASTLVHANQKMKHSSDSSDVDGFPYDAVERQLLLSRHSSSDMSSVSPPGGMLADSAAASVSDQQYPQSKDEPAQPLSPPSEPFVRIEQSSHQNQAKQNQLQPPHHLLHHQQQQQNQQQHHQHLQHQFELMLQQYAKKLLLHNKGMTQQQASALALKRIVYKLEHREQHAEPVHAELPLIKAPGVVLSDEATQSIYELRNTIDRLTSSGAAADNRRLATKQKQSSQAAQCVLQHIQTSSVEDNKSLHFNHELDSNLAKAKHLKSQQYAHAQKAQYALSKAYYDKYGFKMISSSSSSAGAASGGHSSSDDQQVDQISLLKKRKFRDCERQKSDLCDEMKLLKLLEQERNKKAKYTHSGLLMNGSHLHHQRVRKDVPSLKRKRKQDFLNFGASEYKQRFHRRKEAESSSD